MSNTLLTTTAIARAMLANLYNSTIMLPLVFRDYEPEFVPGRGATVNVRKPATFTAGDYNGSTITIQNATETSVPVVMNKHIDVSFAVTSREMTLSIIDFTEQFLSPAMEAIAQKVDEDILALRSDITNLVGDGVGAGAGLGFTTAYTDSDVLVDARTVLSNEKVPLGRNRQLVVPPSMAGNWLKEDAIKQVDASGSTDALREASLGGRISGFNPYESNHISDSIGVGFDPAAFAFVSRPLALPRGANGSIESYRGLAVRVVYDYDMDLKSDVVSIDTLYGVKTMDAHRAVLIDGSGS